MLMKRCPKCKLLLMNCICGPLMKALLALCFLLVASPSWAANWYIRDGGGSVYNTNAGTNQCNGHTNAVYSAGVSPNCAVNNPMLIMGAGCGNYGGSTCTVSAAIAGGDTVDIVGDSDTTPGAQAQFKIGAGVTISTGNCSSGINCTMQNIPPGPNNLTLTIVQGIGSHRPQLYGTRGINQVVEDYGSFVEVSNIEITDHSACIMGAPGGGTVDGFPMSCVSDSGDWAKEGIYYGGTGGIIQNLWIHGIGHNGTDTGDLSGYLSYNNTINGNAFNGDAVGNIDSGGTVTLTNDIWQSDRIVYNGCGEHYPLHSSDPYDTANYHDCYDDNNSGQGDGAGSQANAAVVVGYLKYIDDDISFNTQDGLDLLHATGSGSVYVTRGRYEGNEGQQLKLNNVNDYVENALIIGTCYYFHGQPFTYSGGNAPDLCRGAGDAVRIIPSAGGSYNITNSTLLATGPGIIEFESSGTCGGNLNIYNNNVIGGYNTPQFGNNTKTVFYDPECGSGNPTIKEDYNHVWNTNDPQHCAGAHDKCGDSSAAVTTTLTTSMIGQAGYYSGNDLGHLLYAAPAGQLVGAANTGVTLQTTSNDNNNMSRASSWDMGAYQHNSCVATGFTCFEANECCNSATCSNHVCGAGTSCSANGLACSLPSDCCSLLCSVGSCVSCVLNGNACTANGDCCSGTCTGLVCQAQVTPASGTGETMTGITSTGVTFQ